MTDRKFPLWKIGAWFGIALFPMGAVVYSNRYMFPESFRTTTIVNAVSLFCLFWVLVKSFQAFRRQVGSARQILGLAVVIEILGGLVFSIALALHSQYTRDLYTAEQAQIEIEQNRGKIKKDLDEAKARKKDLDASAAQVNESARRLEVARKKRLEQEVQAYGMASGRRPGRAADPSSSSGQNLSEIELASLQKRLDALSAYDPWDDPKEVRKWYNDKIFYIQIADLFIAILGLSAIYGISSFAQSDSQVPDTIRDIASGMPRADFERFFPHFRHFADALYGASSASLPGPKNRSKFDVKSWVNRLTLSGNGQYPATLRQLSGNSPADYPPADGKSEDNRELSGNSPATLRPDSLDDFDTENAIFKNSSDWEVWGVLLPDIEGARYEPKKKYGSINVIPVRGERHGYIANIGKRDLEWSKTVSKEEWFAYVRDKIAAGVARASEREFARRASNGN